MKVLMDVSYQTYVRAIRNNAYGIATDVEKSVANGKILDEMTRTEVHKEIFGIEPPILTSPYCKCKEHCNKCSHKDDLNCDVNWWNWKYGERVVP